MTEGDRNQLKSLYSGKKYPTCTGTFAPGSSLSDQYFAFVDALQFIYIRNYQRSQIIKRVSLSMFPTCMNVTALSKLTLNEDSSVSQGGTKNTFLVTIGTQEGRILVYKFGQQTQTKLL